MDRGDFSMDVNLGVLTPAPAVRPPAGNPSNSDSGGAGRRRRREKQDENEENFDEAASSLDADGRSHQLDDLA